MMDVKAEADMKEISETGIQKWISVKEGIPRWSDSKGDFRGDYLCIVERPNKADSLGNVEEGISKTVELCYFNNGNKLWQDKDGEWVKVTHWTQIPNLPFHNSILISREEMKKMVDDGELRIVYHMNETEEYYQISMQSAFERVSYDEPLYYSSIRNKHIEDYMYAVLKDNGKIKPNMEYIYLLDMIWKPNQFGDQPIKVGTIMKDVIQSENGGYEFTCKETGERFRTNYAWALAENTPKNIKRIEEYNEEYSKLQKFENKVSLLRNDIITLKPKTI